MKKPLFGVAFALGALTTFEAQQATTRAVNDILGLTASTPIQIQLEGTPGQALDVPLFVGGNRLQLELQPESVRSLDFALLAVGEDGVPRPEEPGPVRTYRGVLEGMPGACVAASWLEDGLYARIRTPEGEDLWVQPAPAELGLNPQSHVFYRGADVIAPDRVCGTDALAHSAPLRLPGDPNGNGSQEALALSVAELGCDADFQYFQRYGSTSNVGDRIESVINTVNLQYESEVEITHQITTILVRTSSNNPYTSTSASTLLNQFRNEWNNNQGGVQRDVAHLFTGKSINGGTIGIAYVGAVCSTFGFGLVESDFNNNFSCATDLSAHELGHNWNAPHCSCTSFTMNPFITCANTFNPANTRPIITSFRDSLNCLGSGGGPGGPTTVYTEDFTSGAPGWNKSSGGTDIWRLSNGCVSSNRSLAFSRSGACDYDVGRAQGWARSPAIDLSGASSATLEFRHFWQTESFSGGAYDRMFIEVSSNNGGSWTVIKEINSTNANSTGFDSESLNVSGFISSTFRVRFRFDSVDGSFNDFLGWYVDDLEVTTQ